MEVLIESKNLRLSPTLITILATILTLGLSLSTKAENKNLTVQSSDRIITTNGAALLKNIKPTQISQNPNSPSQLPSQPNSDGQVDPNIKLPEFQPPQQERSPNVDGVQSPENTEEGDNSQESANDPRVLVAEVLVEGANEQLEDIVYATISTEPGRTTTRTQLQEDVNAVYATGYFQNVEVTPGDTSLGVRFALHV